MLKTLGTHYYFILTNKIKSVLYVGFTNNLRERIHYHKNPEANSKTFTAKYKCWYLVYFEYYQDAETGIDRETQLKSGAVLKRML